MLGHLTDNGLLDIFLSPISISLLGKWDYERMEALEEEADREASMARQLELRLENVFIKSLWSVDESFRIQEASVIGTNCWSEDLIQDSLQRDEVVLEV